MLELISRLPEAWKAVTALAVPFLTVLVSALLDGSDGGSKITASEWITATIAALAAGSAVFVVPNREPEPDPEPGPVEDEPEPEEEEPGEEPDASPDKTMTVGA